jgi:hypothetical protein
VSKLLSFKEEVTFSFSNSDIVYLKINHVVEVAPDVRLCDLYDLWANASGKSNLLQVEIYVNFGAEIKDNSSKTGVVPFRLDTDTLASHHIFSLKFYVGNKKKYWYLLEVDKKQGF